MSVPDDCKTIYVEQTVSDDICNGEYEHDPATQKWINKYDPKCRLQQVYDESLGQYVWAFVIELPEGAEPPPGAVYAVTFPHYRFYTAITSTYAEKAHYPTWQTVNPEPMANAYGYGITTPDRYSLPGGTSVALPQTLIVDDDRQLELAFKGTGYIAEVGNDFFTLTFSGVGDPMIFFYTRLSDFTALTYGRPENSTQAVTDFRLDFFKKHYNDENPIWYGDLQGYSGEVSRLDLNTHVRPLNNSHNNLGTYTTTEDVKLNSFCAIPAFDVYNTWMADSQQEFNGDPVSGQDFIGEVVNLTRYAGVGNPLTYAVRNPVEGEDDYDPLNPNPKFGFYQYIAYRNSLIEQGIGDPHCATLGWYKESNIKVASDESTVCPADADWGDGITVSKEPIGDNGGGNNGNNIKPTPVGSISAEVINLKPNAVTQVSAVKIDRESYTGKTIASENKGWVYDERTSAISGPFDFENIQAVTTKDNSSEMFCVTSDNQIKKTDLLEFNNPNFEKFNDPFTQILEPFDGAVTKGVVLSESGEGFSYRNRYISKPFEDSVVGSGEVKKPLYFRDCYLSHIETNWMHLGDEHNEKQLHRVDMHFHKNSCGHLWLYAMSDDGLVKGQYRGEIKEHMKAFTNLRGRAFKILMFVATHYDYPWAMREMALGHLYGKSF